MVAAVAAVSVDPGFGFDHGNVGNLESHGLPRPGVKERLHSLELWGCGKLRRLKIVSSSHSNIASCTTATIVTASLAFGRYAMSMYSQAEAGSDQSPMTVGSLPLARNEGDFRGLPSLSSASIAHPIPDAHAYSVKREELRL